MIKILLDGKLVSDIRYEEVILKLIRELYDCEEFQIFIQKDLIIDNNLIKKGGLEILKSYPQIDNLYKPSQEFIDKIGEDNEINNLLLFVLRQNRVDYIISNDNVLITKAKKVFLEKKVLNIEEAIKKFIVKENSLERPFLKLENLKNLDINDSFFESLIKDYKGFKEWFIKKQNQSAKAYVSKNDGKINAFLMLKEEGEDENYENFAEPFESGKRLKVSTLKVSINGKKIGETFIKIILQEAFNKKINEIYVTVFPKHEGLIQILKEYGFYEKTYKMTTHLDGTEEKELVLVKDLLDKTKFPYVTLNNQNIIILPVLHKFHKLLFKEAEKNLQIDIEDFLGEAISSNAIKKAFITNGSLKEYSSGDILLFYESEYNRAIIAVGILDNMFTNFSSVDEAKKLIKRRTAYSDLELDEVLKLSSKVIMFKHAITLKKPVKFEELIKMNVIKGPIQAPMRIDKESFLRILEFRNEDKEMFNIV